MKLPIGGGNPITLAKGQELPGRIVLDTTSVYWTDPSYGKVIKLTPK